MSDVREGTLRRPFRDRATLALSVGAAAGLLVSALWGWQLGSTRVLLPDWVPTDLSLLVGAAAGFLTRPRGFGAVLVAAGAAALACWQGGASPVPAGLWLAVMAAVGYGFAVSAILAMPGGRAGGGGEPSLMGARGAGGVVGAEVGTGTWVVVPTYQEAENIRGLLSELRRFLPAAQILVVDDDSPDGTAAGVREAAQADPAVRLCVRRGERGLDGALRAGFAAALAEGAAAVVTLDADGSHDPAAAPALLAALAHADMVIGSRYVAGGSTVGWPFWRRGMSLSANAFARRVLGLAARDCSSGFRAYSSAALRTVLPLAPPEAGFAFLEALLFGARRERLSVVEVPIRFCERQAGRSKWRAAEAWRGARLLWRLRGMPAARAPRARPGFTLMELLTVIAILTLLMALLLPSLVSAQRAAQRSTCVSNIRQLAFALTLYTDDDDGLLPRWNNGAAGGTWDLAIAPYVKSPAVFHCPANPQSVRGAVVRSYALPRNVSGFALAAVPRPTDTVALFEKGGVPLGERADSTGEYFAQTYGTNDFRLWHGNGKVFAFLDGHARFWPVGQGPWAYDFRPPRGNNDYGAGYCGGQINTTADDDGGPGKNLPP